MWLFPSLLQTIKYNINNTVFIWKKKRVLEQSSEISMQFHYHPFCPTFFLTMSAFPG